MPISEIRCYHNGCPKRKFFDSLPIDHIFVYATLGPTNTIYVATGYCILKENHTLTPSSVESEFIKIAAELSPIRVFLKEEDKPKYYQSLNALAFKYEVEFDEIEIQNEDKKIVSSFYIALREKCHFEEGDIAEIKVLRKDEEKTKEAVFLKSLDVRLIKKAIEQLRSIGVYEKIYSKDVTQEYNEEKTPINKFDRISNLGFSTFGQGEQIQDLLHFFAFFLPPAYSIAPLRKKFERIESKDPQELLEKQYEIIKRELIWIRTMIKDEDRERYLDIFADMETHRISYWGWLKKFRRTPHDVQTQSALSNARRDFERILLEAEDSLRELKKRKI